jgi:hypothetical protein
MTDRLNRSGVVASLSFCQRSLTITPERTVVILHSLAVSVEQLCALAPDAPSIESLRPKFCVVCGEPARTREGVLQLVGHGLYCRQVRGVSDAAWMVIWVRRFLCLACGHTTSRLPDWLHPWRWYGATVIIEALWRHCVLGESAGRIGARFGRPPEAAGWLSLLRWRGELLISPTLWGWLGRGLGISEPAASRKQGHLYLERLLAQAGVRIQDRIAWFQELGTAVRRTLEGVVHRRKTAGRLGSFPPGGGSAFSSGRRRRALPTEEDSGLAPPG